MKKTILILSVAVMLTGGISSAQTNQPGDFGITTLTPPWITVEPNAAYWPRLRMWQGIPGIERAPGGRLWATWYSGGIGEGRGHNYSLLVTSGDDGYTWSKPVAVYDPGRQLLESSGGGDPQLFMDENGTLWWFVHRFMKASGEFPRTCWGFYTRNPDSPDPKWEGPVFAGYGISLNKGVILSDGTWLHMIDPFNQTVTPDKPLMTKGAHLYEFTGFDTPFEHVGHTFIKDTVFTEHMVVERKDKSLWMLARAAYGLAQSVSWDKGRTWEPDTVFTTNFNINTRFYLGKLASGNFLLIVNDHERRRMNMTAMLSEDDGETWPYKLVLDERERVSYPDATQAADGTIYATYDRGRYFLNEQEILMAKFTEADVKAGQIISPQSRLKQLINRLADEGGGVHSSDESFRMKEDAQKAAAPEKALKLEPGEQAEWMTLKASPVATAVPAAGSALQGEELKTTPDGKLEAAGSVILPFEVGQKVFSNRDYEIADVPRELKGMKFCQLSLERPAPVKCVKAGMIYILTPSPERNKDSQAATLEAMGFKKVSVRETRLFGGSSSTCTLYQKKCTQGEIISFGKWAVPLFFDE